MGILPVYSGTAMHDDWSSYFKFKCKHALCNSHNLRDLTFVNEEDKQNCAKELIDHLINIKTTVECRKPIDSNLQGQIKKRGKKEANEGPKSVGKTAKVSERSFSLHV